MTTSNKTTQTTINPFLAVLAQETEKLEKKQSAKITKQVTETVEQSKLLAEAACQSLQITLSDTATEFYGLMVASASTDGIAAASGAQLAESVVNMITAYYNGNKESLQPIVDASNMWITTKAKGECKTANLPNNLRLLVSRKSVDIATGEDETPVHDYKLTLSTEGAKGEKVITIKEAPLKAKAKKTAAQKVFDTITKLDVLDADELIRLISTDAQLTSQFATLAAISDAKTEEVTRDTVHQLEARRNAAVTKEDDLQDALDAASETKGQLVDELNDARDQLAENEDMLTYKREETLKLEGKLKRARKEETKAALAEDLEVANEQLQDLLEDNASITEGVNKLAAKVETATKALNKADEAYNSQAHLVAQIGTQLESARTALVH
ncbi:hypothetical protein VPHK449_0012 [Vibrio phage K449]|nr:hypothetical protein SIPHO049v1_p0001 [Vibrio phage PS14A.1]